ncbi:MAG: carboxylating nicotinate-nucleotide diphosphorylase, partial [Pseudomonadota bacterium]
MQPDPEIVRQNVAAALAEDVGSGDVTADLIDAAAVAEARVVVREAAVLCGRAWFDAVFAELDKSVVIRWEIEDGAHMAAGATVCTLTGAARTLLTGERTALNFLQTLSGTATTTARYAAAIAGFETRLLDTRKTLPGLRHAQKYAVACGGGVNHRMGLYDAILIKENHIASAGGVTAAVAGARAANPGLPVEVEVET